MANIYVRMIESGRMTLADVPGKWREEVKAMMEEAEARKHV